MLRLPTTKADKKGRNAIPLIEIFVRCDAIWIFVCVIHILSTTFIKGEAKVDSRWRFYIE